jgi:hypothetical protein
LKNGLTTSASVARILCKTKYAVLVAPQAVEHIPSETISNTPLFFLSWRSNYHCVVPPRGMAVEKQEIQPTNAFYIRLLAVTKFSA